MEFPTAVAPPKSALQPPSRTHFDLSIHRAGSSTNHPYPPHNPWKICTRLVATGLVMISLIFIIVSITGNNHKYIYEDSIWFSPEGFTFGGIAILWNITEIFVVSLKRRRNRLAPASTFTDCNGIHPGAHVGIDLLNWMGLAAAGLYKAMFNYWDALSVAGGSLMALAAILTFILFVWDCVDVDRRRRMREVEMIAKAVRKVREEEGEVVVPKGMALVPVEFLERVGIRVENGKDGVIVGGLWKEKTEEV